MGGIQVTQDWVLVAVSCEHGDETSGYIKWGEFLV
jgi:hypothetical protein